MPAKNIVVIGGGPGTNMVLAGLKRYAARLIVLVSPFDMGLRGSNLNGLGEHIDGREHAGSVDMANVRGSLLALGANPLSTTILERLFDYRFGAASGMSNPTFGHLLLSALTDITGTPDLALEAVSHVLNIDGKLLPLTQEGCPLVAELEDGSNVLVSSPLELEAAAARGGGVLNVHLSRPISAIDAALAAVQTADIVVLGPSDLYFNILAPLQLEGMMQALTESNAIKVYICPLISQPYTTAGWPTSRFIRMVLSYAGGPDAIQYAIVNSAPVPLGDGDLAPPTSLRIPFDLEACLSLGPSVLARPVSSPGLLEFDAEKLARTIVFLADWRSPRRSQSSHAVATRQHALSQGS
jgi:uncharacterized cofD-like protein